MGLLPPNGLYERPTLVLDTGMHTSAIRRADADAQGEYLVTCSEDKTVRLWSCADGVCQRTIRLPAGPQRVGKAFAVAISPDGYLLAAGGSTTAAWLDNTAQPIQIQEQIYLIERDDDKFLRITDLPFAVTHLSFSPNGQYLAAVCHAGGLHVYARELNWQKCASDTHYNGPSFGVTFANDGHLATTCWDGYVRLYDPNFRLVRTADQGYFTTPIEGRRIPFQPYGVAFSPDDKSLAVGFADKTKVVILNSTDLQLHGSIDGLTGKGNLAAVAWSATTKELYAAGAFRRGDSLYLVSRKADGSVEEHDIGIKHQTVMSLVALRDGGLVIATGDPQLILLEPDRSERWNLSPPQAKFVGQDGLLQVSTNGEIVKFGFDYMGAVPARFDVSTLRLQLDPPDDGSTSAARQSTLDITNWINSPFPRLSGEPLGLLDNEISRCLAIHPDDSRFVIGTDWRLHVFDKQGKPLWMLSTPAVTRAVNITGDGRLVVAAYDDGTIRWHLMDDGREVLAYMPHGDRTNWALWTQDGFYTATAAAAGVIRWHVNHGLDAVPEAIPVYEIAELRRPLVLPLVLRELDITRALGIAELEASRRAVQQRTGIATPIGSRLHVIAIGLSKYGNKARKLKLKFAHVDAEDFVHAIVSTQKSLYAEVSTYLLCNEKAKLPAISQTLGIVQTKLEQSVDLVDLAVVFFSGHGVMVDDSLYLIPYGADATTPRGIKRTALKIDDLRSALLALAAHARVLVLIDACHSGAATENEVLTDFNTDLFRLALAATNVTVLASCSGAQRSFEHDSWQNGAFTEVLLQALREGDTNGDGMVSVIELTSFLTTYVPLLTNGYQTPGIEVRFQGNIFAVGS